MKIFSLLALSAIAASPVLAQDTREAGAHEHGVSTLELAIEGGAVELNLTSPGSDIVGFEYEARTAEDKDAVEAAIRVMLTPENLVILPNAAGCRLTEVLAHLHGHEDEEHDAHEGEMDHGDHDDADHAEGEDHAKHEAVEHSEFHLRYKYACEAPDALTEVALPFFSVFEYAKEIEAAFITEAGAGSAEIARETAILDLTALN
ncbi:ZrgA family zinc uptake protein [Celeribacter marinus]|uniref:ZrgA family zinc uptake protein n=1 Tax=Celeribacter marinus TaxID=1397108 RepID=UPI003F6CF2CD